MIMPIVASNLERCSKRGVGAKVDVEVPLPDRAMLCRGHRLPHRGFPFSAKSAFGFSLHLAALHISHVRKDTLPTTCLCGNLLYFSTGSPPLYTP